MTPARLSSNLEETPRKEPTVSYLVPIASDLIRDRMEAVIGKQRDSERRTRRRARGR
jgi:hypothetical protein